MSFKLDITDIDAEQLMKLNEYKIEREEIPTYKFALREDLKDRKEFLPTRAEPKATGWDVKAAMYDHKDLVIQPNEYVKIPLGFRAVCPEGFWYELRPRSSSFAKKHLNCLYGVVDQMYSGELVLAVKLDYSEPLTISFGEAIGQIVPVKRQGMIVKEISNEGYDHYISFVGERGGFGSTGSK